MIPEFREVVKLEFATCEWQKMSLSLGDKLKGSTAAALGLAFEAKITDVDMNLGGSRVAVLFGIYHTCEQFVERASHLEHPFDSSSSIEDDALHAIFELLTKGPAAMERRREDSFRRCEEVAQGLAVAEDEIHDKLEGNRAAVMAEKRFLLFKVMCQDAHVSDPELLRHYVGGLDLTGEAVVTGEFPARRKEPRLSVEQVMKAARWTRNAAMGKQSRSEDAELDAAVWQASKDEIEKKWLRGPFTEKELTALLGPLFVVSRRFGIRQKGKVRVIDDLSESLVNACFGASETVDLGGIDELAVLSRSWLQAISDDRVVSFTLSDGSILAGTLHDSLTLAQARSLAGRTLDLESAYKQLLVSTSSLWAAVLKIHNMDTGTDELYISEVLPFGASASVTGSTVIHVLCVR